MFGLFKKKEKPSEDRGTPRGVLPTHVTDDAIFLCKSCQAVRNAYEIRLVLFMASQYGKPFVLCVSPGAEVGRDLREHLAKHGGSVQERKIDIYSVYIGHQNAQGSEGDGWVFGDSDAWRPFVASLKSQWLKQNLAPGVSFTGDGLSRLQQELEPESISQLNIDKENVKEALLALIVAARAKGGEVFIQ